MDNYKTTQEQRTTTAKGPGAYTLRVELLAATQTKDEVEGALLLDVIIRKSAAVLELLACKDQALLVRRDSLLVLDLRLHIVDSVARLDLEGNCLTRQGLDKDLHPSSQSQH